MARTKPRPSRTSHAKSTASTEPGQTLEPGQLQSQIPLKRKGYENEGEQEDTDQREKQHFSPLPAPQTPQRAKQNRLLPLNSPLRIPSNLQPVYRALGPRNWAEYLNLMLLFCRREIDADEFVQRGELIFKVDDKAARKRMLRLVMSKMVVPFMKEEEEKIEEARREQKRIGLGGAEE